MQIKEKPSEKNSEDKEYYIVSDDLINWMRGVAYTKLTLEEVNGFSEELFNAPTFQQYLDMQQKKPKIITN
tara:strand:+ start:67 stop:279 length:213 start_codon:yes stop_codon:yes gene_type:complete